MRERDTAPKYNVTSAQCSSSRGAGCPALLLLLLLRRVRLWLRCRARHLLLQQDSDLSQDIGGPLNIVGHGHPLRCLHRAGVVLLLALSAAAAEPLGGAAALLITVRLVARRRHLIRGATRLSRAVVDGERREAARALVPLVIPEEIGPWPDGVREGEFRSVRVSARDSHAHTPLARALFQLVWCRASGLVARGAARRAEVDNVDQLREPLLLLGVLDVERLPRSRRAVAGCRLAAALKLGHLLLDDLPHRLVPVSGVVELVVVLEAQLDQLLDALRGHVRRPLLLAGRRLVLLVVIIVRVAHVQLLEVRVAGIHSIRGGLLFLLQRLLGLSQVQLVLVHRARSAAAERLLGLLHARRRLLDRLARGDGFLDEHLLLEAPGP